MIEFSSQVAISYFPSRKTEKHAALPGSNSIRSQRGISSIKGIEELGSSILTVSERSIASSANR
jgi:hypothetical protein